MLRFFIMYSFFPLVTVLLAKGLGISGFYLPENAEGTDHSLYRLWYLLFLDVLCIDETSPNFQKRSCNCLWPYLSHLPLGLLVNIYMKVSMHAISMGILMVFMALLVFYSTGNYTVYLSALFY